MEVLLIYGALLALQLAVLEWGHVIPMRWAEGWLIPHSTPRDPCRIKCATCSKTPGGGV